MGRFIYEYSYPEARVPESRREEMLDTVKQLFQGMGMFRINYAKMDGMPFY